MAIIPFDDYILTIQLILSPLRAKESNENNNKLIRKFIKKKIYIGKFSNKDIKYIQDWINKYPRKLFNYKSAEDFFNELTG